MYKGSLLGHLHRSLSDYFGSNSLAHLNLVTVLSPEYPAELLNSPPSSHKRADPLVQLSRPPNMFQLAFSKER